MEYHYGRFRRIDHGDLGINKLCKMILHQRGHKFDKDFNPKIDSYVDELLNESDYTEEFFCDGDYMYQIYDHTIIDEDYFTVRKDGIDYQFFGSFYNGGTCLGEMLTDGITRINNDKNNKKTTK